MARWSCWLLLAWLLFARLLVGDSSLELLVAAASPRAGCCCCWSGGCCSRHRRLLAAWDLAVCLLVLPEKTGEKRREGSGARERGEEE
ncbi:hypothetical protein KY285_013682 [Solanum tuberosum]|nr:hypothetical protein KY285_013682 [Solanum tuberosum]